MYGAIPNGMQGFLHAYTVQQKCSFSGDVPIGVQQQGNVYSNNIILFNKSQLGQKLSFKTVSFQVVVPQMLLNFLHLKWKITFTGQFPANYPSLYMGTTFARQCSAKLINQESFSPDTVQQKEWMLLWPSSKVSLHRSAACPVFTPWVIKWPSDQNNSCAVPSNACMRMQFQVNCECEPMQKAITILLLWSP